MHEEEWMPRFIACKRRNVAAAYERFLGPTAAALPEPWHSRTWTGLIRILKIQRRDRSQPIRYPEAAAREAGRRA